MPALTGFREDGLTLVPWGSGGHPVNMPCRQGDVQLCDAKARLASLGGFGYCQGGGRGLPGTVGRVRGGPGASSRAKIVRD